MKVMLCEDVDNLGDMGETVTVAPGYARNFLLPRRLAVPVKSASAKQLAHEMAIIKRRAEKRRDELTSVAKQLEGFTVEVRARAGQGDKLYGSITNGHIAEQLAAAGHHVSRKNVLLAEPIKALGIFNVDVKLGGGIRTTINVVVKALEMEQQKTETHDHEHEDDEAEYDTMAQREAAAEKRAQRKAAAQAAREQAAAEAAGEAAAEGQAAAEGDAPTADAEADAEADAPAAEAATADEATAETDKPA